MDINNLNCKELIAGMPQVFNPAVGVNINADIQFCISGKEPGDYFLHIASGQCNFNDGISSAPALTIHVPSEVWLAVCKGELDGSQAFMQGKYLAEGDFSLLMKLPELFKI